MCIRDRNNPALNSSNYDAIYVEYYDEEVAYYMYGNTSARLPDFIIRNNVINSEASWGSGIDMYTGYNPYYVNDNSYIYFGGWLIDNNTINAADGIYLDYYEFCYDNEDNSTTEIGDIVIINNRINADDTGIYVYYDDIGYEMYDNASLIVGNVIIHNNTVNCTYGIEVDYYVYADEYSNVEMGYLNITDNKVRNCTDDGIYIYYDLEASDYSTISIKRALIDGNIIYNCTSDGIYIYEYIYHDSNAIVNLENPIIRRNDISYCDTGIYLDNVPNCTIMANHIYNNSEGTVSYTHLTLPTN